MKRDVWAADRFSFRISGPDARRFLNQAVEQGIRLARLRREENGFCATAFGTDRAALQRIAEAGGWQWQTLSRRGPGRRLEALFARPGLPVGSMLFLCLVRLLGGLVWAIDFGALEGEEQQQMRALLDSCGVREGVWLDARTLQAAQTAALECSDRFGWISLNFTGGCLFIENTEAEYQSIREQPSQTALYAKEGGVIVAVEAESGFAAVEPGQTVEAGQLLVDTVRLDRAGEPVYQGASGRILARVEKSYTALQPTRVTGTIPTSASLTQQVWYLPWGSVSRGELPEETEPNTSQVRWLPLQLGRLCLPGCIRETTVWQQQVQTVTYTAAQAQALARRACRAQLYAEFPDAVIEEEQRTVVTTEGGEQCAICYVFRADIALSGE